MEKIGCYAQPISFNKSETLYFLTAIYKLSINSQGFDVRLP